MLDSLGGGFVGHRGSGVPAEFRSPSPQHRQEILFALTLLSKRLSLYKKNYKEKTYSNNLNGYIVLDRWGIAAVFL